ncbi:MAG: type II toxin-antitoxin system RelE/ParE family toxin [Candidatus Korobacteraceae bacterium]|jgi:plasmid stabilization system protein ParE
MHIRWSPEAADDLQRIGLRIREHNPTAARKVVKVLYDGVDALREVSHRKE